MHLTKNDKLFNTLPLREFWIIICIRLIVKWWTYSVVWHMPQSFIWTGLRTSISTRPQYRTTDNHINTWVVLWRSSWSSSTLFVHSQNKSYWQARGGTFIYKKHLFLFTFPSTCSVWTFSPNVALHSLGMNAYRIIETGKDYSSKMGNLRGSDQKIILCGV
jgi:outer membrane protease